ncbi:hypothetical protein [Shouchella patagoniensis]|uniref:hypothetical protein n=1 Tax=Shouchella patagoniensis TaxID=228576 RepID=UPI0014729CF7|nr:hypothetical protein [Shouchella patagoniensis]
MDGIRLGLWFFFLILMVAAMFGLVRIIVAKYFDDFYQNVYQKSSNLAKRVFGRSK